jgi:LysR family transcriptional regulator, glycine cleavage system transcriptional activator
MRKAHTWQMPESALPPLTALRTFEVAARHLNFTRAAQELCVTQTAVSHQVRQLEAHLGAALFARDGRGLRLTEEGASWARELHEVFARLHDANRRLRASSRNAQPSVTVSVLPSLAARWLVPRLGSFFAEHPGIDVRISPSERLVDLSEEPIDLGIRFGTGRYPGLVVRKLADDALVLVCAPALLKRKKLDALPDLRRHTLLHDDEPEAWSRFLQRFEPHGVDSSRGSTFTDSSMLVAAAVDGQGVALVRRSLAVDELAAGRLVMPLPKLTPLPLPRAYYVASSRERLARPPVAAFRTWLLAQATSLQQLPARRTTR